jgi:hypothetical protein
MMLRRVLALALVTLAPLSLAPMLGCGGDDGGTGATSGTTTGTAGGGAGGGSPLVGNHVLISEVAVTPDGAEFVEIWNPTADEVDLSDYYICDNSIYFDIAQGIAFNPAGSVGIDFLARFPAGTRLASGDVLVLTTGPEFEATYQRCADFSLTSAPVPCGASMVPPMDAPMNGALADQSGGIFTNDGEMLVLFQWSGTSGEPVKDVDYVIWGETLGVSERVDKTGEQGYAPDTAPEQQRPAPVPALGESIQRCALETGEIEMGGNGLTGNDETSEPLDQTFTIGATPDPGVENACLSTM